MENENENIKHVDTLSVNINTISHTVDDMQEAVSKIRHEMNDSMDLQPLLSIPPQNGSIKINDLPNKKIEISYIKNTSKRVQAHRESLLLIYMLLPKKFSATEVTELLYTLPFIDINTNAYPQLIMKFFAFVFKDDCKVISKVKKSKLVIQKT